MTIFNNGDPIIVQKRTGTKDSPYIYYTQNYTVSNNQVILLEVPDNFDPPKIIGYSLTNNIVLEQNQFNCDYQNGILRFPDSANNEIIYIQYWGKGVTSWLSSNIYTQLNNDNSINQTLYDLIINNNYQTLSSSIFYLVINNIVYWPCSRIYTNIDGNGNITQTLYDLIILNNNINNLQNLIPSFINFNNVNFNSNSPIIIKKRAKDSYISYNQSYFISNNQVVLQEIPDDYNGVLVDNYYYTTNDILASNQFNCNYQNGLLTFPDSANGTVVNIQYFGTGYTCWPCSRINVNIDQQNLKLISNDSLDVIFGSIYP